MFAKTPLGQVILLGCCFFGIPGMFNASFSFGDSLSEDPNTGNISNGCLYLMFGFFGLIGGGINNYVGPRLLIFFGGLTYALYIGAILNTNINQGSGFSKFMQIASSLIIGIGAGIIWSAQGALMMAYPTEDKKATFFGIFWFIFNMGPVLGSTAAIFLNWDNKGTTVSSGTLIAFIIVICIGSSLALLLADPETIVRDDGSKIVLKKAENVIAEALAALGVFGDVKMLFLIPAFMASNWFYSWQFNTLNSFFSARSSACNNALYWLSQGVGSILFSKFLDNANTSRAARAKNGLIIVFVSNTIAWVCAIFFQMNLDNNFGGKSPKADYFDAAKAQPNMYLYALLYIVMAALDAMFQGYAYWVMGAMTNDYATLSRYSGFYKGLQSGGAGVSWLLYADFGAKLSSKTVVYVTSILVCGSLPIAYGAVQHIKDHSDDVEAVQADSKVFKA